MATERPAPRLRRAAREAATGLQWSVPRFLAFYLAIFVGLAVTLLTVAPHLGDPEILAFVTGIGAALPAFCAVTVHYLIGGR